MRRFGGSNIAGIMDRLGLEEDIPLEHGLVNRSIENAQTKVESHNFDIRKHVVEYDDVMNKQREVIYGERTKVLSTENLQADHHGDGGEADRRAIVGIHLMGEHSEDWDVAGLLNALRIMLPIPPDMTVERLSQLSREEIRDGILDLAQQVYDEREQRMGERDDAPGRALGDAQRHRQPLGAAPHSHGRSTRGYRVRAYGQRDPLVEYKGEAYRCLPASAGGRSRPTW